MMKWVFDRSVSVIALILLLPLFLVIALWVTLDSRGGVFFVQQRVGRKGKPFGLIKFRTMRPKAEESGKLTVGKDRRITRAGEFLRKYKLDELPQLWNVLVGDMSFVGPRPEVPEYVELYDPEQREVLSVRPGITDEASIAYFDESELLANSPNPEETYVREIMPEKLNINLAYLKRRNFFSDLVVIFRTVGRIFR
jgi:lipopolysaccharide/colanic/teichoic acid biosynthesis glycosyltransferase